jgi:HD-like signal output (HDOD) protein
MSKAAYQKIKQTTTLPSPTGVALEILRLTADEHATLDAITTAVQSDPALSARMLKVVNSPLAGTSRTIVSVSSAIKMLGMRMVRTLALGFSLLSNNRTGPCKSFNHDLFWSASLAQAVAARHLANRLKNFSPDEAFTVGLLAKVGRLALATAFPEAYAYALSLSDSSQPQTLRRHEREMFDIDHNELSAEMMADWHLPDIVCQAVRRQDASDVVQAETTARVDQLARILHLAGSTAAVLTDSRVYHDSLSLLVNAASRVGLKPDLFQEVFESIGQEWRDAGTIFSITTRNVPSLAEIYSQAHARLTDLNGADNGPAVREVTAYARR